jgi:hypothetical protein
MEFPGMTGAPDAAGREVPQANGKQARPLNNGNLQRVHEAVPDRVVKAEALQEMKDRADRVQDAPDREQPQARAREDGCERVVRHDTAPTKQQAKNDGKAIERSSFRAIPMPALNQASSETRMSDASSCRCCINSSTPRRVPALPSFA